MAGDAFEISSAISPEIRIVSVAPSVTIDAGTSESGEDAEFERVVRRCRLHQYRRAAAIPR